MEKDDRDYPRQSDPIGDMRRAIELIKNAPPPPPLHDCRFDGHVEQFMSTRCVYCFQVIRELSVDENHYKLGEFDT